MEYQIPHLFVSVPVYVGDGAGGLAMPLSIWGLSSPTKD